MCDFVHCAGLPSYTGAICADLCMMQIAALQVLA